MKAVAVVMKQYQELGNGNMGKVFAKVDERRQAGGVGRGGAVVGALMVKENNGATRRKEKLHRIQTEG